MNLRAVDILNSGGCSYSLVYGSLAGTPGYAVAVRDREVKIPCKDFNDLELRNYVIENSDILSMDEYFLGAWVDKGMVYLDVSERIHSLDQAKLEGKRRKQKAIYDLGNEETIWI